MQGKALPGGTTGKRSSHTHASAVQVAKNAKKGHRGSAVTLAHVKAALDSLLASRVVKEPNAPSKPSVVQLAAANAAGQQSEAASASAPQTAKVSQTIDIRVG